MEKRETPENMLPSVRLKRVPKGKSTSTTPYVASRIKIVPIKDFQASYIAEAKVGVPTQGET